MYRNEHSPCLNEKNKASYSFINLATGHSILKAKGLLYVPCRNTTKLQKKNVIQISNSTVETYIVV